MTRIDRLSVILSDALPLLRLHNEKDGLPVLPALESLLSAGELSEPWSPTLACARIDPWQVSLLHALGVQAEQAAWASAALSWRADSGTPFNTCLHAEPVHLAAGMDSLQLFPVADLGVEEAQVLFADLHASMAAADLELQLGQSGRWYATSETPLDVLTYSPRSSFAAHVYETMPRGNDGPKLRRLMTELQMLLHEQPLNLRRERQGQKPINAVWFWGAGQLEGAHAAIPPQRILSEQVYVRGLCDYLNIDYSPLPTQAEALFNQSAARATVVIEPMPLSDLEAYWLQKIARALQRGQIRCLEILLDHKKITVYGDAWSRLKHRFKFSESKLSELLT